MAAPTYNIVQNTKDDMKGSDQRSSSWVTVFVKYNQPAANLGPSHLNTMSIIRNDVVSINIENSKKSFGKMCNLVMKSTDFFYPTKINPGDWCFVWMHDNYKDTLDVTDFIGAVQKSFGKKAGHKRITDENSGLKFAGRVIGVSHNDTVTQNGVRTINQTVTCQAFLEFATTVYYTRDPKSLFAVTLDQSKNGVTDASATKVLADQAIIEAAQAAALNAVTRAMYEELRKMTKVGDSTPDKAMCLFYILMMGVQDQDYIPGLKTQANTAIKVPDYVAALFGIQNPTKIQKTLPDIIDLYAGVQKYETGGSWQKNFTTVIPANQKDRTIKFTGTATKGFVPLIFNAWDNVALWDIMNTYLNPVCNEIYTCLRMGPNGRIKPTIVIREKPFSTGLFNFFDGSGSLNTKSGPAVEKQQTISKEGFDEPPITNQPVIGSTNIDPQTVVRTLYGTLPRWVISEDMVRSFSYRTNEASRINFVQIWGTTAADIAVGVKIDHNERQSQQLAAGNYFFNQPDIERNGLRAYILESRYDLLISSPTAPGLSKIWARMNADWLFNGHLKLNGQLIMNGVQAPIVEGDNLQYRGLLFHIESVSHQGSLSPDGKKNWVTTVGISNGVIAASLDNPNSAPVYHNKQISDRKELKYPLGPGISEIQDFKDESPSTIPSTSPLSKVKL